MIDLCACVTLMDMWMGVLMDLCSWRACCRSEIFGRKNATTVFLGERMTQK